MICVRLVFYYFAIAVVLVSAILPCRRTEAEEAQEIQLEETELQRDTVLPRFDRTEIVKSRRVSLAGRIEIAPYLASVVTEPIYTQYKFGAFLNYHTSEDRSFGVNFAKFVGGLNAQYTSQLARWNLDFHRAPSPNYSIFAIYQSNFAYGKLSFSKASTITTLAFWDAGLGVLNFSSKTEPGCLGGLGLQFYFNKSTSLRTTFNFQYAQQPSPFIQGVNAGKDPNNPTPAPRASDFPDKWTLNNVVEVGLSVLL